MTSVRKGIAAVVFNNLKRRLDIAEGLEICKKFGCSHAVLITSKFLCGSRTCKPNSVCRCPAGRSFLWATHYCGAQATYPEVVARRAGTLPAEAEIPPYLVLLRVGFALPAALLRRRCALTAPFHPYLSLAARAVCFLWHFPSNRLEPAVPDVIRHTALRSSDFPPVLRRATVRSGCQPTHYSAVDRADRRTVFIPSAPGRKHISAEQYRLTPESAPKDIPVPRPARRCRAETP